MTRIFSTVFLILTLTVPFRSLTAQASADAPPTTAPSIAPSIAPSTILEPGITSLKQALVLLRPEKWKASGAITAEAAANIESIERDLGTTLPPLLSPADANPGSMPQVLPVYRNIEALYDVLVRVTEVSVLAAPAAQSAALQQATTNLAAGRRELGDRLQSAAQSQDNQLRDLQAQVHTLKAIPPPTPVVCPPPPAPAKKTKPRPKAAKPATPPPATP